MEARADSSCASSSRSLAVSLVTAAPLSSCCLSSLALHFVSSFCIVSSAWRTNVPSSSFSACSACSCRCTVAPVAVPPPPLAPCLAEGSVTVAAAAASDAAAAAASADSFARVAAAALAADAVALASACSSAAWRSSTFPSMAASWERL